MAKPRAKMTRRQLLAMTGAAGALPLFANPVSLALRSLVDGVIGRAQAGADAAKNYVFVYLPSGMPRWYFDLVLKTAKNDPKFVANPHLNTRFVNNAPVYDTLTAAGYEIPALWGAQLPTTSGARVPMTGLLDNLFSVRGVNMQGDGHPVNALKQIQPVSSAASLSGLVADASGKPVPAIGDAGLAVSAAYRSPSGVGQAAFNRGDPNASCLSQLLTPFDRKPDALPAAYLSRRQAMGAAVEQGLSALAAYANTQQPGAASLYAERGTAEKLMSQSLGDLGTSYTSLLQKYRSLIAACATESRPGVTDAAISSSALPAGPNGSFLDPATGANHMANFISPSGVPTPVSSADMRTLINATVDIPGLAQGFAVAEYMLIQGYSSSVVCGFDGLNNVPVPGAAAPMTWVTDEHLGGTAVSIIINSFLYHALATCLHELIGQLSGAGIWQDTVIHIGSEFSRSPRVDCIGSDHGWSANLCTLLSGSIRGPVFLGNTTPDPEAGHAGSYGMGAPVPGFDGGTTPVLIGNVASTVAAVLGVDTPTPNNQAVADISASTGKIDARIGFENV